MAEYYPLISRAVAGLREGAPEARKAIYDRARQALIGQLRSLEPAVPEEAIARETAALDDAIARAESEIATPAKPDPVSDPPPAPPSVLTESPAGAPPVRTTRPAAARPEAPIPTVGTAVRPAAPRPEAPRSPVRAAPRPSVFRAAPVIGPTPELNVRSVAPAPDVAPAGGPELAVSTSEEPNGKAMPAVAALKVDPVGEDQARGAAEDRQTVSDKADADGRSADDGENRRTSDERSRDEMNRPAAPRPVERRPANLRIWIVTAAALAAVVVIALAAWRLRDDPQQVARPPTQADTTAPTSGKIVERADGTGASSADSDAGIVVGADQAASPVALQSTVPSPAPATTADTSTALVAPVPPASAPAIPVAYKAAVLVDAPELPEKVKTYVGTVVWRTENVAQGQDQPTGMGIRADIDIPEAKTQVTVQIRRNTEAQFPASHTVDLKFTIATDSPLGSIKQINVPQMRKQDLPTGDPLSGIPVTIADNYFLVGLIRGAAEERNIELLRSRGWFDVPLLLGNGKPSKITFEKGTSGERIFNDVLDAWKNAQN